MKGNTTGTLIVDDEVTNCWRTINYKSSFFFVKNTPPIMQEKYYKNGGIY